MILAKLTDRLSIGERPEGKTTMKFRKLMLAVLGLAIVAGMTAPANALTHHHKRHHKH
jgi:hypothetical protein